VPLSGTRRARARRTGCALSLTLVLGVAACSNPAVDKAAGSGAGAGIAVKPSADGLTIENHTTRPLLNVRITVTAAGSEAPFVRVVPAMEPDQDTAVRFADLATESGTLLDAAVNAPQSAAVAARDTLGNSYSASARW
jgi:hypothetical protein